MKTRMTCEEFRTALVDARRGAGNGEADTAQKVDFEAHRAACPSCAQEAQRDEWLCDALQAMPEETPHAVTWSQVLAAHPRVKQPAGPAPRRPVLRPRVALGFASAVALAALVWTNPFDQGTPNSGPTGTTPNTGAALAAETATFTGAHALLSASDITGDPNRSIVLMHSGPSGGDRS